MFYTKRLFLNIFVLFSAILFSHNILSAQSEKMADKAFKTREFYKSYELYKNLLKNKKDNPYLWYKYAEAARLVNDYKTAEKYYTKVLENSENIDFAMCGFRLAQIKKNLGKYELAIELLNVFIQENRDDNYSKKAMQEIQSCNWAIDALKKKKKNMHIDLLDYKINSDYSESAAFEMGNHLYYSTARYINSNDKKNPHRRIAKMMVSKNLEKGRPALNLLIDENQHYYHTAFSVDWQRIYFTLCEFIGDTDEEICQIYYLDQDEKGRWKKEAIPLPDHINLAGYTTTQPSIGFDSIKQSETLYFVSDRPGGLGNLDIWFCEIRKNEFSIPHNLEEINTPENDITPFFHSPSQTLYFSSEGRVGMGGFDIFSTNRTNKIWNAPENLGDPFNSSYNDLFFTKNTNGNRAYLSSNRLGSRYPRKMYEGCCMDIYRIYFPEGGKENHVKKNRQ